MRSAGSLRSASSTTVSYDRMRSTSSLCSDAVGSVRLRSALTLVRNANAANLLL